MRKRMMVLGMLGMLLIPQVLPVSAQEIMEDDTTVSIADEGSQQIDTSVRKEEEEIEPQSGAVPTIPTKYGGDFVTDANGNRFFVLGTNQKVNGLAITETAFATISYTDDSEGPKAYCDWLEKCCGMYTVAHCASDLEPDKAIYNLANIRGANGANTQYISCRAEVLIIEAHHGFDFNRGHLEFDVRLL